MPKFRRKPIEVEACRFWPQNKPWPDGIQVLGAHHWANESGIRYSLICQNTASRIMAGDWIVTNQTGERYVVLQEMFKLTYEAVE